MQSGASKSDAPAVLAPEPEPYAPGPVGIGVVVGNEKDGAGEVGVGVPAPGAGQGLDYTPFAPALELPSVEYQATGSHIHMSSWPPNRKTPTWLIYVVFVLGSVVTLIGNVPFGVAALALACLAACGRGKWGGRRWAIASAVVGTVGLLVALAGWGVLAAWLIKSSLLQHKYCTEENYTWRTSQVTEKCQCSASSWSSVTMCCEYDSTYTGNSTCCLTVYDTEDKSVETLCGDPLY